MPEFINAVAKVMEIAGADACSIVDIESGECLTRAGGVPDESLATACIVNARMLRSNLRMAHDQYAEGIEDVLISMARHYHLIRLIHCESEPPRLFLYVVLERDKANLAMARRKVAEVESSLVHLPNASQRIEAARARYMNRTVGACESKAFTSQEEAPPFMRDDVVLKLLGMSGSEGKAARKLAPKSV